MISPKLFVDTLAANHIDFFTGVPDSLLKNVCAYIADNIAPYHNIIAANEGAAIGIAVGHYLATGKIPVVYMQNSGEGNVINPLTSLTDKEVYNIPVLLLIGWRGQPGVHDEPQHVKQGKVTIPLLDTMGIKYAVMSKDADKFPVQLNNAVTFMQKTKEAFAFIVEKDTFDTYQLQLGTASSLSMNREEAIRIIAASINEKDCIVSTTGMISRELFEYRTSIGDKHERDFLTVGSMGHASQVALGIALEKTDRKIWCFDGDGAVIMHMGSMAIIGSKHPRNYVHVVFNNGAHDSVGGQPTVGLDIDLPGVARSVGYESVHTVSCTDSLEAVLSSIHSENGPVFLEVKVRKGNRKDLGRPTLTPVQIKESLMEFLK